MRKYLLFFSMLFTVPPLCCAQAGADGWKSAVTQSLPLLGHRNWILIVDSAYPLQTSPGVETIETNASHAEVLQYVLGVIGSSIHVRPVITMDAELPFVPDDDAPGAAAYRKQLSDLLRAYPVSSLPHEKIIADIADAGAQFHVLVLKTTLAIPYTSVFIRLDCKYWTADAEKRLRARMAAAATTAPGTENAVPASSKKP